MTGKIASLVVLALLGPAQTQSVPPQLTVGASVEVCGEIVSVISGRPDRCDATLEVKSPEGPHTVVVPASVRRATAVNVQSLQGAEGCFTGTVEREELATRIRIPSFTAVRVTKAAAEAGTFDAGTGAIDSCRSPGLISPRVISETKPQYTPEAMRAGVQGAVVMDAIVEPTGAVSYVRVTRPLDPQLDEQAIKALRQWKFEPGTLNGAPVRVIVSVEMTFSLRSRR